MVQCGLHGHLPATTLVGVPVTKGSTTQTTSTAPESRKQTRTESLEVLQSSPPTKSERQVDGRNSDPIRVATVFVGVSCDAVTQV